MFKPNTYCRRVLIAGGLLAVVALGGCATPPSSAVTGETWSTSHLQRELAGEDKWEGFNRAMFSITDVTMDYVVPPLCTLYCSLLPRPLIDGIDNAIDNSEYPVRLISTLCRGEWKGAWDETCRFTINSTLGLGGLFDPAQNWFGIFSTDATFSGTLAAWGVAKGPQLSLPFVMRSNVRDTAGYAIDQGLDPKTYVGFLFPFGYSTIWTTMFWPNYAAVYSGLWEDSLAPLPDRYRAYMQAMTVKSMLDEDLAVYHYANDVLAGTAEVRRPAVRAPLERPVTLEGRWRDLAGYEPRSPALDTLRAALFAPERSEDFWWYRHSLFNSDYLGDVDYREIELDPAHPAARYGFVPASESAAPEVRNRVVFIIPGVGGDCQSNGTLAMSELLSQTGVATVLCDDPFCWQYFDSVNAGVLPGYLPADAKRFAAFMHSVVTNLVAEGDLAANPEVSVVGWSMGGLLATHMAAAGECKALGLRTGDFLAINPPVEFEHVATALDQLLEPTREMSLAMARTNAVEISRRLVFWNNTQLATTPDLSETDAGLVVSTVLGAAVPQLVAYAKGTNGVEQAREYYRQLLTQEYPELTEAELIRNTGMLAHAEAIAACDHLAMIHTRDDFLLTDSDRDFLDHTLKDRITWFTAGAHCGMFYTPEFKAEVLERLHLSPLADKP